MRFQLVYIVTTSLCLLHFARAGFTDEPSCLPCEQAGLSTMTTMTSCPAKTSDQAAKSIFDGINYNKSRIALYGWLQTGITVNEYGQKNRYDSPYVAPVNRQLSGYSGNSQLLMLEQQSDFKLNQLWLGVQRLLDTSHGFDWGFQVDTAYGTDLRYCQSFNDKTFDYDWGHGDYYLSIVSLYGDLGYKNLSLRVGKFNSEMSNESFAATETFFYSKTYSFFNAPTVSGVKAAWQINDRWTVLGAWTTGENTSFENRFDDNGFLIQTRYKPTKSTSLKYSFLLERNNGLNKRPDAAIRYGRDWVAQDQYCHQVVFVWDVTTRWRYAAEGFSCSRLNHRNQDNDTGFANGFNHNVFYKINERWSVGGRYEWLKARNTFFDLRYLTGGSGTEINSLAFAVNWQPTLRVNVRSEIRYDVTDYHNGYKPFDAGKHSDQWVFGCAGTVKF